MIGNGAGSSAYESSSQAGVADDRGSWPLSAGAGSCANEGS